MTPHQFISKWKDVALTERQTAQEHFIDLCRLMDHPTPIEADRKGEWYCFEKGAMKSTANPGFADVWKKDFFAFEYKKRKRNLQEALAQLSRYAWDLQNPPLLVACDTNAFRIVTAWTRMPSRTFDLSLQDLAEPEKFDVLRNVFHDPERLKGAFTREMLTKEAADKFSGLALRLQARGHPAEIVAHFIMQLVFCYFAEDVKLLPEGFFRKALRQLSLGANFKQAKSLLDDIFAAMATGGRVGLDFIDHFNGGLFDGQAALPLDQDDIGLLIAAGSMEWAEIDPSIYGTLFERFLDPAKRKQIGAHYTDAAKIMQIIEPVIMRPLEAEWATAKVKIEALAAKGRAKGKKGREWRQAEEVRGRFLHRLTTLSILDPACGSGNFLYLALQRIKTLELRANLDCEEMGLQPQTSHVGPEILHGIEINPLAAELARATIWIGDIQWGLKHGVYTRDKPILRKLDNIECRDALIAPAPTFQPAQAPTSPPVGEVDPEVQPRDRVRGSSKQALAADEPSSDASLTLVVDPLVDAQGQALSREARTVIRAKGRGARPRFIEATWPRAEFIVGNPPFLGAKLMKRRLGVEKTEAYRTTFAGRLAGFTDLVCYWFEKAREAIVTGSTSAAGLVATSSIRGGTNRPVLDRISAEASIFEAWDEQPWVIEGARVEVSLVCFGRRENTHEYRLNGIGVSGINADLTSGLDLTKAKLIAVNRQVSFLGVQKTGPLDVEGRIARAWLSEPINPNGQHNSLVLIPYWNGDDLRTGLVIVG